MICIMAVLSSIFALPMSAHTDIFVSLIIPCYNDHVALKRNLPYLVRSLDQSQWQFEIILVNDGGIEKDQLEALATDHGLVLIHQVTNQGKGAAVRAGVSAAKGNYIVFTDADIPYEWEDLKRIVHYLDFKEFDFAAGDRTLPESNYYTDVNRMRGKGSRFFSWLVGRFIAGGMYDTQCGIKGFRKAVALDLFSVSRMDGFSFDVELYYIALKRNYDIKRLPVRLRSQDGQSVQMLKHGITMLFDLPRIVLNFYRGKYKQVD